MLGYYTDRDEGEFVSSVAPAPVEGWRENANWKKNMPPKHLVEQFDAGCTWSYHAQEWEMPWINVPTNQELKAALLKGFDSVATNGRWSHDNPYNFAPEHELAVSKGGTGTQYITAFRYVYNLCKSLGYTYKDGGMIRFCYVPTLSSYRRATPTAAQGYPGDEYVDLLGVDAYNKKQSTGRLGESDADKWIQPVVDFAKSKGKPWIYGECGIGPGSDRAAFIDDLTGAFQRLGEPHMLLYSDVGETLGKQRYYVTDDVATEAAFHKLAESIT